MLKQLLKRYSNRYLLVFLAVISPVTFQTHVNAEPNDQLAENYRTQGYAEQQKGNLADAFGNYTRALLQKPDDAATLNDMGVAYEQFGLQTRAEYYYRTALKADKNYLPAYMNLGYLYLKAGYASRAFYCFKMRYELGDQNDPWTVKAKKQMLIINPQYDDLLAQKEVENLNRQLISESQNDFYIQVKTAAAHFHKGKHWINKGDYKRAIHEFDLALAYTPENPRIVNFREQAILEMTLTQTARETIKPEKYKGAQELSAKLDFSEKLTTTPNEQFISK